MADKTKIQWTDKTWSPIVGCTRASRGCQNCYSERFMARFSAVPGHKFEGTSRNTPQGPRWTGVVRLHEPDLYDPLRWRDEKRVFVNSISDTFHEAVPDEWIVRVWAVMAMASEYRAWGGISGMTFQVLTKRAARMQRLLSMDSFRVAVSMAMERIIEEEPNTRCTKGAWPRDLAREVAKGTAGVWPTPGVWVGISAEDQQQANERLGPLVRTPASVRFVSYEPALAPVDIDAALLASGRLPESEGWGIGWLICGAESGPGARPFYMNWARDIIDQCRAAGTAVFVKQVGKRPQFDRDESILRISDPKGGEPSEWPADLRVREFPGTKKNQEAVA